MVGISDFFVSPPTLLPLCHLVSQRRLWVFVQFGDAPFCYLIAMDVAKPLQANATASA